MPSLGREPGGAEGRDGSVEGCIMSQLFLQTLTDSAMQQLWKRRQMAVNTQRRNCLRARGREARCPEGGLGWCHSRRKLIQARLLMGSEGQRTTTVETTECVPVRSPGSGVGQSGVPDLGCPHGHTKGRAG